MSVGGRITAGTFGLVMAAAMAFSCSDDENDNRGVNKALVACLRSGAAMASCMTNDGGMTSDGGMDPDGGMLPEDPGVVYVMGKIPPAIYRINGTTAALEKSWNFADAGVTGTAHHVVVDSSQTFAYATIYNPARLVAYNLVTGELAKVLPLGTFAFDDPHDVRLIQDEKYLVISVHREEQLVVVDTGTLEVVQRILRRCPTSNPSCTTNWPEPNVNVSVSDIVRGPHAVVVSPDQKTIAVGSLNTDQPQVVFLDLTTTTPGAPLANPRGISLIDARDPNITSAKPSEMTWTPDSKGLYVGTDFATANNFQPNEPRLWYIDVDGSKAHKLTTVMSVPNDLVLTCDGKRLFFNVGNFTQTFDLSAPDRTQPLVVEQSIDTGSRAHGIARSPDCRWIYTTNEGANWVTKLSVTDFNNKTNIPGVLDPEGIFVAPSEGM